MIAVDMLTHAIRRNMEMATLLTSELDFKPLIDALVQNGMFVTICYQPQFTTKELLDAADRRVPFTIKTLEGAIARGDNASLNLPRAWSEVSRGEFAPVLAQWEDKKNNRFRLMRVDNNDYYLLDQFDIGHAGHSFYIHHADLEYLRNYAKDVHSISIPEL